MLKSILALVFAGLMLPLIGQTSRRTDSLTLHAPEFKSLESLVEHCLQSIPKQDRSRFYFGWIANNIRYHHRFYEETPDDSLISKRLRPEHVFEIRRTICAGYSALFERLCYLSGIPNWEVKGYSVIGRDTVHHTWNLLREDGRWYTCDPTWGANFMLLEGPRPNSRAFWYYQSKPALFATEHLPFDKKLSLIEPVAGYKTVDEFLDHEWSLDSTSRVWRSAKRGMETYPLDSTAKLELGNSQYLLIEKNMNDVVAEFNKLMNDHDDFSKPLSRKKADRLLKQVEKIRQNTFANRLLNQQLDLIWSPNSISNHLKIEQREKFPGFIQAIDERIQKLKKSASPN